MHLHNPVLAYSTGDDFLKPFHQAARGELDNFVLVIVGTCAAFGGIHAMKGNPTGCMGL